MFVWPVGDQLSHQANVSPGYLGNRRNIAVAVAKQGLIQQQSYSLRVGQGLSDVSRDGDLRPRDVERGQMPQLGALLARL